jgi:hypothetical protein
VLAVSARGDDPPEPPAQGQVRVALLAIVAIIAIAVVLFLVI